METRLGISFKDEADIDSKQLFWWDALTCTDSWPVLSAAFVKGEQKPVTLNAMEHLRRFSKTRKRVPPF